MAFVVLTQYTVYYNQLLLVNFNDVRIKQYWKLKLLWSF